MSRQARRRSSPLVLVMLMALAACQDATTTAPHQQPTVHLAQGTGGIWTVNTLADPGNGVCDDAECTLREAIASASGGHLIVFAPGLTGTIFLTSGALEISSKNVVIAGDGRIAVSGNDASRVFKVTGLDPNAPASVIKGLTVRNGVASSGAGIVVSYASLVLDSVVVAFNRAETVGGGIELATNVGNITIRNSAIVNNSSKMQGGGVVIVGGTLDMTASEVSNNSATDGGGVWVYDLGAAAITRSTISSNTATNGVGGVGGGGRLVVRSSTITLNNGTLAGGLSHGELTSSIVAGNKGTTNTDCAYLLTSGGHNIFAFDCVPPGPGDIVASSATVFSNVLDLNLKNNGGPTRTHALLPRGLAVDKGDCAGETADQRGFKRPVDDAGITNAVSGCDIGAYEVQGADLMVSQTVDKTSVKQGDLLTYAVRVQNLGSESAPNVVLTDVLSSGVTFVEAKVNKGSVTAPPKGETGTVTWNLGSMATNANEVTAITVTVLVRGKTTITNTATAAGDIADPNAANNSASITVSVAAGGSGRKP
ncbi:MAG TPA: choice-of-anchor Q domain-containing protein [Gemmatimonadaceae bacterium]|nr:choice-of-anchor Q domain-containing protein [Gemmatimonadaceae bacterium]